MTPERWHGEVDALAREMRRLRRERGLCPELMELYRRKGALLDGLDCESGEPPRAVPEPFAYRWDVGAPMPQVLADGWKTMLLYDLNSAWTPGPGDAVTVLDEKAQYCVALLTWEGCRAHLFGGPNDEVMDGGHYLPGAEAYEFHTVEHSRWLARNRYTNAYHFGYDPDEWDRVRHYLLAFHDQLFECLAEGFRAEVFRGPRSRVAAIGLERLHSA